MAMFKELSESEKSFAIILFKAVKIGGKLIGILILIGFLISALFNSSEYQEDPSSGISVAVMVAIAAGWFFLMSWIAKKMIKSVEENGTTWKWLQKNG